MMRPHFRKTPEVMVVISSLSGADRMTYRVTMSEWQWHDIQEHASYAEKVFDAFSIVACEMLELDPTKCKVLVDFSARLKSGVDEKAICTGNITSPLLFLH